LTSNSRSLGLFQRFLQVVAPSGHGSATGLEATTSQDDDFNPYGEWPGARAPDVIVTRRRGRFKRVAIAFALPLAAFFVMMKLLTPQSEVAPVETFEPPITTPEPTPEPNSPMPSAATGFRSYALEITALDGLPPNASPGTALEIWVTWEPPVTRSIRVQKLIPRVYVQKIIPNIVPEGPATAMLRIPKDDVADVLYGDRFGRLSAIVLPNTN
jgi:hypothetical protein